MRLPTPTWLPFAPPWSRSALRRFAAAFVLLAVGILGVGCRSSDSTKGASNPKVTPALIREVRVALNFLPPVEAETFREFLPRARAAMLLADSPSVRGAARRIPEDPLLFVAGQTNAFFPVILAEWAMRRERNNRVAVLQALTRLRTGGDHLDPARPGAKRRKNGKPYPPDPRRFRATLRSQAARMDLRFKVFDDSVLEIGKNTRGNAVPKVALSSVLLARGDTTPVVDEDSWERPPFSAEYEDGKIHGRGTLLAKGPMVAALFALDALIDSGVPFARPPLLLIDLASGEGRPKLKTALRRPSRDGENAAPPPSNDPALATFFADRGRPARVFAVDSQYFSTGESAGQLTLNIAAAAPQFGPQNEDDYRLVAAEASAGPNALPAQANAIWLLPNSVAAAAGDGISPALKAALPATKFVRDRQALTLDIASDAGAVYAVDGPQGATATLAAVLSKMKASGALASTPCSDALISLSEFSTTADNSAARFGPLRTTEDGGCSLRLDVLWTPGRSADAILDDVKALLPVGTSVAVVKSVAPHQTRPLPAVASAAQEATAAYSELDPKAAHLWHASGTRDVLVRQTERGLGLGPLSSTATVRADAPNEFLTIDEFDTLVAVYAYALARAGR